MTSKKPNILVIWGDDIGIWNLSAYSRGSMGYRTPNIDSIAKDGAIFTDHYAQPSCTAGRAAFITGQLPIRTGLTTIGLPGTPVGLQHEDPTLAQVLQPLGYATGQSGKNHLGDRNEHLPTVHGFDEFFGNLYHLNAEEETMDEDYPDAPQLKATLGPRGVLHSHAADADDASEDPRFGRVGRQTIQDTGPLTRERMENVDQEFIDAAFDFMDKAQQDGKPFFIWLNTTRMHVFTHVPEAYKQQAKAFTSYSDLHCAGMLQHDEQIGQVLSKLQDLGISEDTVVVYSTDNGPEHSTWPHGSTTPYRSEKMTTWEGGLRVPMMVKWPGHITAGTELNGIHCGEDVRCAGTSGRFTLPCVMATTAAASNWRSRGCSISARTRLKATTRHPDRAEQSQHKSGIMNIMLHELHELGEHLGTFKAYPPHRKPPASTSTR